MCLVVWLKAWLRVIYFVCTRADSVKGGSLGFSVSWHDSPSGGGDAHTAVPSNSFLPLCTERLTRCGWMSLLVPNVGKFHTVKLGCFRCWKLLSLSFVRPCNRQPTRRSDQSVLCVCFMVRPAVRKRSCVLMNELISVLFPRGGLIWFEHGRVKSYTFHRWFLLRQS